jgi:hypothetical protein
VRQFYKTVQNYKSAERPVQFDIKSLYPGLEEAEVAEELGLYFNRISNEFSPLDEQDIPLTYTKPIEPLEGYQVAARLKAFKKPKSRVVTDIFPDLVTQYAALLAIPLTNIYNSILATGIWPKVWKQEFVTAIPKKSIPEGPNDLRNISCTALVSKVFESFVMDWLKPQVALKTNQFGGVKGTSVEHLLCEIWHEVGSNRYRLLQSFQPAEL